MAASPDGSGPWADSVTSATQGLRKDNSPVPAIRSNSSSTLGVAENDTVDGHFYSLGFGGSLVLKFDNTQSGGAIVVEATNLGYPEEKANVEVSENGTTWVSAGTITQDGEVHVPQSVCVKYVRVTDVSNKDNFTDGTADGYDVDGVKLTGNSCKPQQGGGGDTTVIINQKNDCVVTQSNTTSVVNAQSSTAISGNNKVKKTTGSNNTIKTGKAKTTNKAKVESGSNVVVNPCCCGGGDISVTIGGNGGSVSDPQSGCGQTL